MIKIKALVLGITLNLALLGPTSHIGTLEKNKLKLTLL